MSQAAPDIARQMLEALGLPGDHASVKLITTSPLPDSSRPREQRYREALPGRMREIAGLVTARSAHLVFRHGANQSALIAITVAAHHLAAVWNDHPDYDQAWKP